ncbi:OmpA family protein [Vibrio mediterranei]|uniref:OmpA family protein n=2 Tax=Vibrio mediterranei TaxID=689 RepID=A0A3G4VLZ2_9VIBR|nr:OmpA family protein [Vibrio mediterranei]AYV25018.1 OmpA family protein [Vibrio mediterranei]
MRKNFLYIALCAIAPTTWATEHKFVQPFVGIRGGYQWAIDSAYTHQPPNNALISLYGGLLFSPSWRWDLGYQYQTDQDANQSSISINTRFVDSALRYDWLLSQSFSFYGRVGFAYWDMDKTHPTFGSRHARGFSPLGEVGGAYQLSPQVQLSTGYQYINAIGNSHTGQYDSHAVTLGLTYSFGQQATHTVGNTAVEPDTRMPGGDTETSSIILARTYGRNDSFPVNKVDNQTFSIRRAQSLINQGVDPAQIQVSGQGEQTPIASNDSAEGQAKNRRVEATIPTFNVTVGDTN